MYKLLLAIVNHYNIAITIYNNEFTIVCDTLIVTSDSLDKSIINLLLDERFIYKDGFKEQLKAILEEVDLSVEEKHFKKKF